MPKVMPVRPNVRVSSVQPTEQELVSRSLSCFESTLTWSERFEVVGEVAVGIAVLGIGSALVVLLLVF